MKMTIDEFRGICEPSFGDERNKTLCKTIAPVDEPFIYHVDRAILAHDRNKTPLKNLEDVVHGNDGNKSLTKGNPWYNTFDFGTETKETFSRFLAVCKGNKPSLRRVLNEVKKQSKKIADKFSSKNNQEKTVIVLTDKWDPELFQKYERVFLNYALQHGIWYIFLLITDYGYTQIPFLPNDRDALRDYENVDIEEAEPYEALLDRLEGRTIKYIRDGGTLNTFFRETFIFDEMRLEKYGAANELQMSVNVPRRAFQRFLESVKWIDESDTMDISAKEDGKKDEGHHHLSIFGKSVSWGDGDVGELGEPKFQKLQKAIDCFVAACEKNNKSNGK